MGFGWDTSTSMRLIANEENEGVYWRLSGKISFWSGWEIGLSGQQVPRWAVKSCSLF